eukprot:1196077-Prorocentrum_minimum.AAC.2
MWGRIPFGECQQLLAWLFALYHADTPSMSAQPYGVSGGSGQSNAPGGITCRLDTGPTLHEQPAAPHLVGAVEDAEGGALCLRLGAVQQSRLARVKAPWDGNVLVTVEVWRLVRVVVCEVALHTCRPPVSPNNWWHVGRGVPQKNVAGNSYFVLWLMFMLCGLPLQPARGWCSHNGWFAFTRCASQAPISEMRLAKHGQWGMPLGRERWTVQCAASSHGTQWRRGRCTAMRTTAVSARRDSFVQGFVPHTVFKLVELVISLLLTVTDALGVRRNEEVVRLGGVERAHVCRL